jgi:hypothetical protein
LLKPTLLIIHKQPGFQKACCILHTDTQVKGYNMITHIVIKKG